MPPLHLVGLNSVSITLVEEGMNGNHVEVVKEANTSCSTDITLLTKPVIIERGLRQSDRGHSSSKL